MLDKTVLESNKLTIESLEGNILDTKMQHDNIVRLGDTGTHTVHTHSTHTVHTQYTHTVHRQYTHTQYTHTVHTHSTHTQYTHTHYTHTIHTHTHSTHTVHTHIQVLNLHPSTHQPSLSTIICFNSHRASLLPV